MRLIFGFAVLAVIGAALLFSGDPKPKPAVSKPKAVVGCGTYRTDKLVTIGSASFNTEVVTTQAAKDKGLSGRPCIEPNQAMLFVFDKPSRYFIWMKGMRFPIDIVWITTDHKVAGYEFDVPPSSYPTRFANKAMPAQYVLEFKANAAKSLAIDIGTTVTF
jgi:uncharacterized membrane protein (UPF0127 family)